MLIKGDIEDIIVDAIDTNGTAPVLNDGRSAHLARFGYDIVNLDFNSGFGYRSKTGPKRVEALKKLFERQQGHNFMLLLSVNVRDTLGDQIEKYLRGLQERPYGPGWCELIEWYLSRGDKEKAYKLKAVVLSFVQIIAEHYGFQCVPRPPIVYQGHNAQMVHFAFEFECCPADDLRAWSRQDDRGLMDLPLLRCERGEFMLPQQHPGFDGARLEAHLSFLPSELRNQILAQLPAVKAAG